MFCPTRHNPKLHSTEDPQDWVSADLPLGQQWRRDETRECSSLWPPLVTQSPGPGALDITKMDHRNRYGDLGCICCQRHFVTEMLVPDCTAFVEGIPQASKTLSISPFSCWPFWSTKAMWMMKVGGSPLSNYDSIAGYFQPKHSCHSDTNRASKWTPTFRPRLDLQTNTLVSPTLHNFAVFMALNTQNKNSLLFHSNYFKVQKILKPRL